MKEVLHIECAQCHFDGRTDPDDTVSRMVGAEQRDQSCPRRVISGRCTAEGLRGCIPQDRLDALLDSAFVDVCRPARLHVLNLVPGQRF